MSFLVLSGCGAHSNTDVPLKRANFSYNQQNFSIDLPETWNIDAQSPSLFAAQYSTQNVLISPIKSENFEIYKKKLLPTLHNQFFASNIIEQGEDFIVFNNKTFPQSSIREFHQQIIPIPNHRFLLATCSFYIEQSSNTDCKNILKSIGPAPNN